MVVKNIKHIFQPTEDSCGQTCVSMLTNVPVEWIQAFIGNRHETSATDLARALKSLGINYGQFILCNRKSQLPDSALVLVECNGGNNYHWVLLHDKKIYDPSEGVYSLRGYRTKLTLERHSVDSYMELKLK